MRAPSRFSRGCLLLAFLSAPVFALEVGDPWAGPPAELGPPLGKLTLGGKTILRWPELEVTVTDGRITRIRPLDAASVSAEIDARTRANAAEYERLSAERRERARAEAAAQDKAVAAAAREAKLRLERLEAAEARKHADAQRAEAARAEEAARRQAEGELRARAAELEKREADEKAAREAATRNRELAETASRREADAKAAAERKADEARERAAAAAARATPPTPADEPRLRISLVDTPADPVRKLEREIVFLELDLRRAETSGEPGDRAESARLRRLLREKRAELEALRKATP